MIRHLMLRSCVAILEYAMTLQYTHSLPPLRGRNFYGNYALIYYQKMTELIKLNRTLNIIQAPYLVKLYFSQKRIILFL